MRHLFTTIFQSSQFVTVYSGTEADENDNRPAATIQRRRVGDKLSKSFRVYLLDGTLYLETNSVSRIVQELSRLFGQSCEIEFEQPNGKFRLFQSSDLAAHK